MSYGKYKTARPQADLPPAPPLSPAARTRAAKMRDEWREQFNGDDSLIRDLVEAGMIYGWRDVQAVYPNKDANDDHA